MPRCTSQLDCVRAHAVAAMAGRRVVGFDQDMMFQVDSGDAAGSSSPQEAGEAASGQTAESAGSGLAALQIGADGHQLSAGSATRGDSTGKMEEDSSEWHEVATLAELKAEGGRMEVNLANGRAVLLIHTKDLEGTHRTFCLDSACYRS